MNISTQTAVILLIVTPAVTFLVGFLLGWFIGHNVRKQ